MAAIDKQIVVHRKREFDEQAKVIAYFENARDILLKIRERGGAPAAGHPSDIAKRDNPSLDTTRRNHSDTELKAFLKPVPPKSTDEALKSFETVGGFELQCVAHEPLVVDPIAAQTATSITLIREEDKTDTILRGNIEEQVSNGKPLMPEGFEKKISKQEMADLISFLQRSRTTSEKAPLEIGTLPGSLIEPDTSRAGAN